MESAGRTVHTLPRLQISILACCFTSELSLLFLNGSNTVRSRDSREQTIFNLTESGLCTVESAGLAFAQFARFTYLSWLVFTLELSLLLSNGSNTVRACDAIIDRTIVDLLQINC